MDEPSLPTDRITSRAMFCQAIPGRSSIVLLLCLAGWAVALDVRAQFRSAEQASRLDTMRSLAAAPLAESRSLDRYVRDANTLRPMRGRLDDADRYDPTLSGGQKLLLGAIGLVVQSFCDTDELTPMTVRPDFALEPGERTCVHCDQMEDRAWDAVWGRSPSSTP